MFRLIQKQFRKSLLQEEGGPAPTRAEAPRIFARVFSGPDGACALSYLRATVNARVAGPEAGEAMLRYQDGQRGLLQTITGLIEQGRNQNQGE
ncbi:MAG: hypothetical protein H6865_05290 [Rhodospirillales bacterium]|nr:hypothetical protein [Alphaproteobacteria bacterium]MCB9987033.1 hypothetical protein [Rhodospirillales bacterium]USO08198.1 MAG: hypothetical protein H6866_03000 [Rhodospirillales bacterium]